MSKYYKVWVEVEKIDEEEDHFEIIERIDVGGEFKSEEEAMAVSGRLVDGVETENPYSVLMGDSQGGNYVFHVLATCVTAAIAKAKQHAAAMCKVDSEEFTVQVVFLGHVRQAQ